VYVFVEERVTLIVGGLVGNPRSESKTLSAATSLVEKLAVALGGESGPVVDLADFGGRVLDYSDADLAVVRTSLTGVDVLVVATPVYKGSYTGLLKSFLDGYGPDALASTLTVPLTIAASPAHSLAGPTHLQPVLDELGALSPAGGIFIPDALSAVPEDRDAKFDTWISAKARFLNV
jgi:FMN reductase